MRRKITDLREERASAFEQMKSISEGAEAEGRDFTAEESQEYQRHSESFDSLSARVDRLEREEGIAPLLSRQVAVEDVEVRTADESERSGPVVRRTATPEYEAAFRAYAQGDTEARAALQVGTDSEGGYTVPDAFLAILRESEREFGVISQAATHFSTAENGQVKIPSIATYGTSALTAEEAAFTQSEDTFGELVMDSYKYGRIIKISDELVTDSAFDVLGMVARLAGQSLSIATGAAYAVGTGTSQPNGLFTAASTGKTAAAVAAITADELIDLYHSVLSPYRSNSTWVMNDSTAVLVRKLKDGNSQYLWQPGLQAGQPDVLLGRPVLIEPNAPTAAAAADSVAFGDVSKYWIRDVEGVTVKVLDELYAATGQIGFRVHMRTDGDLTDTNAVKVLTQAAV